MKIKPMRPLIITIALAIAPICAFAFTPSPSFVAYLKQVEGYSSTVYYIGGLPHIGYGHQIKQGETFLYLNEGQAERLLISDIMAQAKIIERLQWSGLSNRQMEMLVDFQFNGCGRKQFPKFWEAVRKLDERAMRAEYKRHAGGRPLTGRNSAFAKRFFR